MPPEAKRRPDFWTSSGFGLLTRDAAGRLAVTDEFLRAYFGRPELAPVAESCPAERALHGALVAEPRRPVTADELAGIADPDARENWRVVLRFRDLLTAAGTVEGCYLKLFESGQIDLPPLFIDQMAQVILRNALDGCDDPYRLRAAETLFRSQKVTIPGGAVLLGDEEVVESYATSGGFGELGRLLAEAQTPMKNVDLDVLNDDNAASYWQRSDRYDMVLDLTFGRPGLDALCRVFEAWIAHFLDIAVTIQPVQQVQDERWVWHIGLDPEANAILNDLYNGVEVEEERIANLLSLFRLEFRDPRIMVPSIAGRPVYLGIAMGADAVLRLKPQNLLLNLPIAAAA